MSHLAHTADPTSRPDPDGRDEDAVAPALHRLRAELTETLEELDDAVGDAGRGLDGPADGEPGTPE